ncbi:DUF6437 family protein [Sphingomonas sp. H39-1-10]|uniref:DUF6437 family protein n=1 Tax=Sphingomonas pollutisoli TaxID=3030829 RepID=UPI0023B9F44C|nr:DUF6437 family protein [Sphingomonas pollutisoli]MDF0490442.1 DUF6437 family protein [Sphingomonas pollutisoli]
MPKKGPSNAAALARLANERAKLDAREREIVARVGEELGAVMVAAGLADMTRAQFAPIAERIAALGVAEAARRLA